jgi:hypothetical protein
MREEREREREKDFPCFILPLDELYVLSVYFALDRVGKCW